MKFSLKQFFVPNFGKRLAFMLPGVLLMGAFVLEAKDLGEVSSSIGALPVIAGCVAAFLSGFFALAFLMRLIRRGRLEVFAFYLVPVAILGLLFL